MTHIFVIPAKAGIQGLTFPHNALSRVVQSLTMDSRLRGNDNCWSVEVSV